MQLKLDDINDQLIEAKSEEEIEVIKETMPKNINEQVSNKFKYGQYFTKVEIVEKVFDLLNKYKKYDTSIKILEPSYGTGNFLKVLDSKGYKNVVGCEIDPNLSENPMNFFDFPLKNKFNLIIGNPPFTKYNIPESYYYPVEYENATITPNQYISDKMIKKEKHKIENIFILKAIEHLQDSDSTLAFVLPISFFIKNRNTEIKEALKQKFSTIIIFQNTQVWFDYNIPCCFAIFTNTAEFSNKILIYYENDVQNLKILDFDMLNEEIIPEVIFNKEHKVIMHEEGIPLTEYLTDGKLKSNKSFQDNNTSARNILEKIKIPDGADIADYKLAVVRVGNSSVGKCGLINIKKDVLNDMFYVIDFKDEFQQNKDIKERVCAEINKNHTHFKNITCRVGSKSIKKEDILNFCLKERLN